MYKSQCSFCCLSWAPVTRGWIPGDPREAMPGSQSKTSLSHFREQQTLFFFFCFHVQSFLRCDLFFSRMNFRLVLWDCFFFLCFQVTNSFRGDLQLRTNVGLVIWHLFFFRCFQDLFFSRTDLRERMNFFFLNFHEFLQDKSLAMRCGYSFFDVLFLDRAWTDVFHSFLVKVLFFWD